MWECSNCSEQIDDDFDVCWSCQAAKDGSPPEAYFKPKKVPRELADLQERMSAQTDSDLLRIVNVDFNDYREEAIDLARAELERRGLIQPPRPKLTKKVEIVASKPVNEKINVASASSTICLTCAAPLDEDAKFCPSCAAPVAPDTMINCPKCGKSVSAESMFCKYCAAELTSKKEYNSTPRVNYSYQTSVRSSQRGKADNLAKAGGVTAVISAIAFLWGYNYTSSFANTARAGLMNLAGQTDSTYTLAQFCITLGTIGFIIGVVLLIVGLAQR